MTNAPRFLPAVTEDELGLSSRTFGGGRMAWRGGTADSGDQSAAPRVGVRTLDRTVTDQPRRRT